MRVLHLIDSLRVGGKERQLVELLKGLRCNSGIELLLVCMDDDDFYASDIRRLPIQVEYLIRKCRWDPIIFPRLYRLVQLFRPQIIHTSCWMTSFYALPVARLSGVKLINGSIRNAFPAGGLRWKVEKILLSLSDCRVANSKAGLLSRNLALDQPRNVVIHNGFDASRIQDIHKADLPSILADNRKIVGMVAEFSDLKDYGTFFLAAKAILKKRKDVLFLALGDGKYLDHYREIVADHSDGVKLLGKVRNVEEYVMRFEIGVLASFCEGISNSILEYMALAKPVIATDAGGTRETVLDGITGILVPQRSWAVLAEKIESLLDNPSLCRSMGLEGRKLLEREFSLKQLADKTLSLYESVLKPV